MKKFTGCIVVLLFLAAMVFPTMATADKITPINLSMVVHCMKNANCKNAVLPVSWGSGKEVFFIHNERTYIFYLSKTDDGRPFISILVRPDGAGNWEDYKTFYDLDLDGQVDYGIEGAANWTDSERKLFKSIPNNPENQQLQRYWQSRYNKALAAARHVLF